MLQTKINTQLVALNTPFDVTKMSDVTYIDSMLNKANGAFWTSTAKQFGYLQYHSDWTDWCTCEQFGNAKYYYLIEFLNSATVWEINTIDDFVAIAHIDTIDDKAVWALDITRIKAMGIDGIHITNKALSALNNPTLSKTFCGACIPHQVYDVESTMWFNLNYLFKVTEITDSMIFPAIRDDNCL